MNLEEEIQELDPVFIKLIQKASNLEEFSNLRYMNSHSIDGTQLIAAQFRKIYTISPKIKSQIIAEGKKQFPDVPEEIIETYFSEGGGVEARFIITVDQLDKKLPGFDLDLFQNAAENYLFDLLKKYV